MRNPSLQLRIPIRNCAQYLKTPFSGLQILTHEQIDEHLYLFIINLIFKKLFISGLQTESSETLNALVDSGLLSIEVLMCQVTVWGEEGEQGLNQQLTAIDVRQSNVLGNVGYDVQTVDGDLMIN